MISTGAFQSEVAASNRHETLAEKFARVWEKKNSKSAKAGSVSLMALSLAACGSDDVAETPAATTPEAPAAEAPVTEAPTTPVVTALVAGSDATGTAGADSFSGTVAALTANTTLVGTDTIAGGEGADTIALALGANFGGFTVTGTDTGGMTGVETVELSASDATARTFDATGVSGVETYKIDGTTAVVSITDAADLAAIELSSIATGAFSITFAAATGGTSPVAGTADTLNLTVQGMGSATADISVTAAGAETLALVSNAAATAAGATNYLNLTNVGSATVKVTGAADTDIAAVSTSTTSFDASGATGAITAALGNAGNASLTSVSTAGGADKITANLNDFTTKATVALGDGADQLTLSSVDADTVQLAMTGVETVDITGLGATTTMSLTDTTGLTTAIAGSAAGTSNYGVTTNFVNATAAMNIDVNGTATGSITTDTAGAVDIDAVADSLATLATNDAVSTTFGADEASSVDLSISGYTDVTGNISADKATSVTVTTGTTTAADIDIDSAKAETVTVTSGGIANFANTGSDFSGAKVVTVDTTKLTTMPALAAAHDVNLSGSGSASQVITGALGTSTNAYAVDLDASGLKGGLQTGAVATGGTIDIDASGTTGGTTLGTLTTTGAVTVKAGAGAQVIGAIDAGSATIDLSNVDSTITIGDGNGSTADDITVGSSVTITSAISTATVVDINGDKTSLTVDVTGGLGAENIDITYDDTADFTGVTVKGDYGAGADAVDIEIIDTANTTGTVTHTYDVSAVSDATVTLTYLDTETFTAGDKYIFTGSKSTDTTDKIVFGTSDSFTAVTITDFSDIAFTTALSLNPGAISGQTIDLSSAGALTIAGLDTADSVDLSGVTNSGSATAVITMGDGADTITLSATTVTLAETITVAASDSTEAAMDTISNFQAIAADADELNFLNTADHIADTGGSDVNVASLITGASTLTADSASGIITLAGDTQYVDTLAEWIDIAEAVLGSVDQTTVTTTNAAQSDVAGAFEFGGHTYVISGADVADTTTGSATAVAAEAYTTSGIVKLADLTGVTAVATTSNDAANTILIA